MKNINEKEARNGPFENQSLSVFVRMAEDSFQ